MQVGTARIDITPPGAPELSGYAGRIQPSTGVLDPIQGRAIYLYRDENERLLWLHADVLCFENEFVDEVKSALQAAYGLKRDQVILSATHTHSAPTTMPLINAGEPEPDFTALLGERLIEVAAEAMADPGEAATVAGEADAPLAVDRRGKPSAHVDPRLGVVGWRRENGDWVAVVANYAMHNVLLSYDNRKISGDVAGAAARWLEENLPGAPVALWTNGAAANLNPPARATELEPVREMGQSLARTAARALEAARPLEQEPIRTATDVVSIPLDDLATSRRFAEQYLADLEGRNPKVKAIADFDDPTGYIKNRLADGVRRWEALVDQQAATSTLPRSLPMELQVAAIGPLRMVGFAAEVFSRIRGEIAEGAGRDVMIIGYANGYNGYLSTPEAIAEGGYEPDMSFIYGGIPRVAPGGHELARDRAIEMVRALD